MQNTNIDPETQKRLNTPLAKPSGFEPQDQTFLNQLVSKIESGQINLYTPSSILNHAVYDKLDPAKKAQVDTQSFATLSAIREIVNLWKAYQSATFQIDNLLHKVRLTKEQFETSEGDVFII